MGLLVTGPLVVGADVERKPTALSDEDGEVINSTEEVVGFALGSSVGTSVIDNLVGNKVVGDIVGNADKGDVVGGFAISCSFNRKSSFFRIRSPAWPFCVIFCLRTRR